MIITNRKRIFHLVCLHRLVGLWFAFSKETEEEKEIMDNAVRNG
jgi:hypothetical protein